MKASLPEARSRRSGRNLDQPAALRQNRLQLRDSKLRSAATREADRVDEKRRRFNILVIEDWTPNRCATQSRVDAG